MSINQSIRRLFRSLFSQSISTEDKVQWINRRRDELTNASDEELKNLNNRSTDLLETIAITAVVAARVLGLVMFDVQLQGALALAQGKIAEMQTGEGKTLAAVPAVVWFAKQGRGVHVMTANDYLARRDAEWMGSIYKFLGISVGCIQQKLNSSERKRAYASDVTYGTANELGFDYLRDQLALKPQDQVRRLAFLERRQAILDGTQRCASELVRLVSLRTIDDLWCEYLSALSELHAGIHWISLTGGIRDPIQNYLKFGGFDPFREYVKKVHDLFEEFQMTIETEIPKRLAGAETSGFDPSRRGATWTYITTDQPFGIAMQQALRNLFNNK